MNVYGNDRIFGKCDRDKAKNKVARAVALVICRTNSESDKK